MKSQHNKANLNVSYARSARTHQCPYSKNIKAASVIADSAFMFSLVGGAGFEPATSTV
jgi:hypothetical protein